jgi:alpha-1,3-rhamnosyl/mannosyltransferase
VTPRIGIDVRKIRDGGIGRYLEGLLGALAAGPGDEEFVLFGAEHDLPATLRERLRERAFRFVACDAGLYSLRELFAFRGAARRHGLHLMHFPHYVRSLDPGCPVTITIHDCIHLSHPPSLAARLYAQTMLHWAARSAATLFVPSESTQHDVSARLGVPAERIHVSPNGVDARFAPRSEEAKARFRRERALSTEFVLCVGTHRSHKNVGPALDGFHAANLADAEIVLAAADSRTARPLRDLAAERARVLLDVADHELPLLYASARIVLAPSLAEGFGLVPLEAAACGAAVLASAIPAHHEVLADAAAWIAAPAGAVEIAAALTALWRDDARRADLSARGVPRARLFPWSRCAEATRHGWRAAIG